MGYSLFFIFSIFMIDEDHEAGHRGNLCHSFFRVPVVWIWRRPRSRPNGTHTHTQTHTHCVISFYSLSLELNNDTIDDVSLCVIL